MFQYGPMEFAVIPTDSVRQAFFAFVVVRQVSLDDSMILCSLSAPVLRLSNVKDDWKWRLR